VEAAPTPAPAPATPPPAATNATIDAAWEGVVGYDVVMELVDGGLVEGRVSAVQRDTFTLIDFEAGGVVRVMRKSDVQTLRVAVSEPLPANTGTGLMAGGGVLLALGSPVLLAGLAFLAIYPAGFVYLSLPMFLSGGPAVGAGAGMLAVGVKRQRAYRAALQKRRVAIRPAASRTRLGTWTGGLRLTF
jgi:hypothetical protein